VRAKKELGSPFVTKIRRSRLEAAVDRVKIESDGNGAESATNDDCPLCLGASLVLISTSQPPLQSVSADSSLTSRFLQRTSSRARTAQA